MKPQPLKGFRDFLPEEMRIRNFVLGIFKETFERFGFEPLETPSVEYASTLLGKYGEEADRLIYRFQDRGGRNVGLIYDLTVPTARVLAQSASRLTFPFKRYQIQKVWRAENPQKGRYREFTQCDFDIFGAASSLADAEIIAVIAAVLNRCGLKDFSLRVNSRPLLFSTLEQAGITDKNQQMAVLRIIDKLDKTPPEKVLEELKRDRLSFILKGANPDDATSNIIAAARNLGVEERYLKFDPALVRGLDYYTGMIVEADVEGFASSVAGGGRYDNLVKTLGGPDIPAVGASLGLDRIVDILKERNVIKRDETQQTNVMVATLSTPEVSYAATIASELRANGINTELYPDSQTKLDKQLKYADRKHIPWVIIIGKEELQTNSVTLKNLRTGEQETVDRDEITKGLKTQNSL